MNCWCVDLDEVGLMSRVPGVVQVAYTSIAVDQGLSGSGLHAATQACKCVSATRHVLVAVCRYRKLFVLLSSYTYVNRLQPMLVA